MANLSSLCVYCGASTRIDGAYLEAAHALGRMSAQRGIEVVFGGGRVGVMGALAEGVLSAGGKLTGIIPRHLMAKEHAALPGDQAHGERVHGHGPDEAGAVRLEVVANMHQRKMRMVELADAFAVLPGGFGTLDETFEIVTWRQLGLHGKPVVLVNLQGFWDPLIQLIEHQAAAGFVHGEHRDLIAVVERPEEVFDTVAEAPEPDVPLRVERA